MRSRKTRHDAQRALDNEQARQRKAEIRDRSNAESEAVLRGGES